MVRIELREQEGALLVRAFGADPAEPFDWGEVEATRYGTGVTAGDAVAFSAVFDFGFLVTVLAGYTSQGILTLDTFNTFHRLQRSVELFQPRVPAQLRGAIDRRNGDQDTRPAPMDGL